MNGFQTSYKFSYIRLIKSTLSCVCLKFEIPSIAEIPLKFEIETPFVADNLVYV